jgi:hypothetical protein
MQRRSLRVSVLLAAVFVAACAAPTKLIGTWQNDTYNQRLLRSVLVIANTPDLRIRQMAEREFVRQFEERKVQALASFEVLGSQTEINRENVGKAIRDTDIDAVFAISVVDERTEDREVPGVTHNYSEPPRYYYNFYDYNERSSTTISAPGYTTTSQIFLLESNLYDAGTADLMWTATTQTTDPRSAEEALPPLTRVLMKTLDRGGFFR